jgi:hypothetical protein
LISIKRKADYGKFLPVRITNPRQRGFEEFEEFEGFGGFGGFSFAELALLG